MLTANLSAAGIQPEDVGTVIISHFHADHISGLRRKLEEDPERPRHLLTVCGLGYRLVLA